MATFGLGGANDAPKAEIKLKEGKRLFHSGSHM